MFTGIIEVVGRVEELRSEGGSVRLVVSAPEVAAEVRIGDSIAVNGACLTVTRTGATSVSFDAVTETLEKTALAELSIGAEVNLERAMRAGARLDGHIVQGHVDGTGRVRSLEQSGEDVRLAIDCDGEFAQLLVEKGSVAIEGVSLTVVGVEAEGFDVALIPHTLSVTTLGGLAPGRRVNLEADVLGKYVKRNLDRVLAHRAHPAA
jgi:riboflavin synthase